MELSFEEMLSIKPFPSVFCQLRICGLVFYNVIPQDIRRYLTNQTLGGLFCTGILLLIQIKFPPSIFELAVLALVVTDVKITKNHLFHCRISTLL